MGDSDLKERLAMSRLSLFAALFLVIPDALAEASPLCRMRPRKRRSRGPGA